ncbi:MAG: hypothetical protein WDO56_09860 [Gammaproteobacteria bacterium]
MLRQTRLLDIYAESLYYTDDMQHAEQAYREEMNLLMQAYAAEPDNPTAARRVMRSQWATRRSSARVETRRRSRTAARRGRVAEPNAATPGAAGSRPSPALPS